MDRMNEETYVVPEFTVRQEKRLPAAPLSDTKLQWIYEAENINQNYPAFIQSRYFVNNMHFIKEVFKFQYPRICVYAATGCMKSCTSYGLEKFFSKFTPEEEQIKLADFFQNAAGETLYNKHAHKYTVFRCSFETLYLKHDAQLLNFTQYIFRKFLDVTKRSGIEVSKEDIISLEKKCSDASIFYHLSKWLKEHTGNDIVIILDEIDYPLTFFLANSRNSQHVQRIWRLYREVLDDLSMNTHVIPIVLGFGIHVMNEIVNTKCWAFFTTMNKKIANYFMFSHENVLKLVAKYKSEDDLIPDKSENQLITELKECYGNYMYDMYAPASVVRYLENKGAKLLYKKLRRTFDILSINNMQIRAFLSSYVTDEQQVDVELCMSEDLRQMTRRSVALGNYVLAGLLRPIVPENRMFIDGQYSVVVGNLENLNIIGFFIQKFLSLTSTNAAEKAEALMNALNSYNFGSLENILNELFRNLDQIELACERDYHNPIHAYFYALLEHEWKTSSEYSLRTGCKVSGLSGRIDLRVTQKTESKLFIFELKYSKNATEKDFVKETAGAFQQVRDKGYIRPEDVQKFDSISVVAVICTKKVVRLFSAPAKDIQSLVVTEDQTSNTEIPSMYVFKNSGAKRSSSENVSFKAPNSSRYYKT